MDEQYRPLPDMRRGCFQTSSSNGQGARPHLQWPSHEPPTTSYWLSDALRAALKRDPLNAALDAEVLAIILARRADEHAAHALAWMVVQRAATGE